MAGNSTMNENERGLFALNGITGMLIAVVLLLSILGTLTYFAIKVQQEQSQNFYTINQDINALTSGSIFSDRKQNTSDEQLKSYQFIGKNK